MGTLTGVHHDAVRRFENTPKADNAQVYGTPDTEKIRQMQKARFIQQQLESEQKASVYVAFDGISYQPEKPHVREDYGAKPNMCDEVDHGRNVSRKYGDRSNELSAYPENRIIYDDPQFVERLRKGTVHQRTA